MVASGGFGWLSCQMTGSDGETTAAVADPGAFWTGIGIPSLGQTWSMKANGSNLVKWPTDLYTRTKRINR
ncbi:hypothetical protein L1987_80488 [Smallanthus sonchifolius]|uniref:Uncharacterized protein n=1 Tax=Smallanthus sonchifolius TaxID=185202 RepID=A0ACB8YS18_9ASTR|nr:hypothetical protein L1987_80488 [Smallanthus sonchifolius]